MSALNPADLWCKYLHDGVFLAIRGGCGCLRGAWKKRSRWRGAGGKISLRNIAGSTPREAVWVSWAAGERSMVKGHFICQFLSFARQSCSWIAAGWCFPCWRWGCCFHGSNGAAEKPFDALAEMVFNLKEKVFLVRTDAFLPLGQGLVMVSDAA